MILSKQNKQKTNLELVFLGAVPIKFLVLILEFLLKESFFISHFIVFCSPVSFLLQFSPYVFMRV